MSDELLSCPFCGFGEKGTAMRTITPTQALQGNQFAVVGADGHIYGLYPTKDIACRICNDLARRYGDGSYHVAAIDFGEA